MSSILFAYIFVILVFFIFFEKFSSLINVYDLPNHRKHHTTKTSLVGGVFLFAGIYIYLIISYIYDINHTSIFFKINTQFISFLVIALSFFLIGFIDDKKNISPNIKIVFFFILILFSVSTDSDLYINILYFSFSDKIILLQNFSIFFTIFSIFIFINALNMYDGSNGQLGIYSLIFLFYLSYKINSSYFLYLFFPLILFLYLNLKKITFAGNSGSYFLGYFLSYIVIKIYNSETYIVSDEIVLLMFYPVMDLIRLFFYRLYNKQKPFSGDRNHIHHILQIRYNSNFKVQSFLLIITVLPLLIYEATKINIFIFILINSFVYFFIVKKLPLQN